MKPIISGIQQIGVGIPHVYDAWKWYRQHFYMNIPIFDEAAEAALMLPYTGGQPRSRHAVLALNSQGGGGMEIWQYTSRTPEAAKFDVQLGDYGIFIAKVKTRDVQATFQDLKNKNANILGDISNTPEGKQHFYVQDPYANIFEVVPSEDWFRKDKQANGGMYGCTIGVSDIDKSRALYSDVLGYDTVVYDETGTFDDLKNLAGGKATFRRVLLRHSQARRGSFSRMLGSGEIELVQVQGREAKPIFKDRLWGDLGFIHLCFDINGMKEMRELCAKKGFPFTVDTSANSDTFDMGEAAGHFSYIEDPDGTLIEFVETHKLPILKKINWYLDLRKRNPEKPLPNWMLKTLAFNKVKD